MDWTTQWFLREDTPRAANTVIVNAHHRHPLTAAWGGGTLSSSDGLRLPMRGRSLTARALSRYFLDEGVTSYTHVSDQHSTYGTQIIVSTERDATFTLDEILGNTTELPIAEHTTDSHGQTLATFALFDLVGLRLSPRIAKLTDKRLWRPDSASRYQHWPKAGRSLSITSRSISSPSTGTTWCASAARSNSAMSPPPCSWPGCRLAPASTPSPKPSSSTASCCAPCTPYAGSPTKPSAAASAASSTGAKPSTTCAGSSSSPTAAPSATPTTTTRPPKAHCHTLVVNACILSTSGYLQDAIDARRAEGHQVSDEAIAHLSPAHFEAINPYGTLAFDVAAVLNRARRPLRRV